MRIVEIIVSVSKYFSNIPLQLTVNGITLVIGVHAARIAVEDGRDGLEQ